MFSLHLLYKQGVEKTTIYDFSVETLKMSHGEVTVKCLFKIPCHSVTSHLKSFYGEVSFLDYNYILVVNAIPTQ